MRTIRLLGDMHSPEEGEPLYRGSLLTVDDARADRMVDRGMAEWADGGNARGVGAVLSVDVTPPVAAAAPISRATPPSADPPRAGSLRQSSSRR